MHSKFQMSGPHKDINTHSTTHTHTNTHAHTHKLLSDLNFEAICIYLFQHNKTYSNLIRAKVLLHFYVSLYLTIFLSYHIIIKYCSTCLCMVFTVPIVYQFKKLFFVNEKNKQNTLLITLCCASICILLYKVTRW